MSIFEPVPENVRKRLEAKGYSNSTDHPFTAHREEIVAQLRSGKRYIVVAGKGYKVTQRTYKPSVSSSLVAFLRPADGSLIPCGEVSY